MIQCMCVTNIAFCTDTCIPTYCHYCDCVC